MIKIGDVFPENPFILGPMAGVTDRPFRLLCRRHGAGGVCMEMVSANAILHGNRKTNDLIHIDPEEHPVSLQIFGPDPETMKTAAAYVSRFPYDVLDINMGCPVPKVVKNGEGSALMLDPDKAGRIVEACVKAQDRPVSVKIRSGFDASSVNAPEIARICEEAGASLIAVHARTREQYYSGSADWDVIRRVVQAVRIPVAGNGDVTSAEDAVRMMRETGCAYVMIARAARGNPWIFGDCVHFAGTGQHLPRPERKEIAETMLLQTRMAVEEKGEYTAIPQMRKHVSWYTAGCPDSAAFRQRVNEAATLEELSELVEMWAES